MPGMNKKDWAEKLDLTYHDVDNLTIKELKFIGCITEQGLNNPGTAYKKAGFKVRSNEEATSKGKALMVKPEVRTAIDKFVKRTMAPYKERIIYRIVKVLEARSFWNIRDFFTADHKVKNLDQIPEEFLYAIESIKEDFKGKDADRRVVTMDLADREKSVKLLISLLEKGEADVPTVSPEHRKRVQDILKASRTTTVKESVEVPMKDKDE